MPKWKARERESGHVDIYMNDTYVGTCGGDFPVFYLLKLLEDANAAQQGVQRTCANCGKDVHEAWSYCIHCGASR